MNQPDEIVIVGAGLIGLSLAAALARNGIQVSVLDTNPRPELSAEPKLTTRGNRLDAGGISRVSAVNPGSQIFLSQLGAWERIDPSMVSPFYGMEVWDGRGTSRIQFGEVGSTAASPLGFIVANNRIELALIEVLEELDNARVDFGLGLADLKREETGYSVALSDGSTRCCSLLVGADGGNSKVRDLVGIRNVSWSYKQTAVVTTVQTAEPHGQVARQCFTQYGPLALLPLSNPHLCSVVWSLNDPELLLGLDDEAFCRELDENFEHETGAVLAVEQRTSFPLQQQHALRYISDHVALIGDAAHTIHPLAGQGANLGFADARILAQVLAAAKLEGRGFSEKSVLARYQRQRGPANLLVAGAMEVFKRLYDTDNPGINWLRNAGMRFIGEHGQLKSLIIRLASAS